MSWFYHYVKEALSCDYNIYLQGSFTKPGEFYCTGGCDAIALSRNATNDYYICEIKSIDENPTSWLNHPEKEEKNNPKQYEVREYWIKQNETNENETISSDSFAWAFVIAGQLEQYFLRNCRLKYKLHKKMPIISKSTEPSFPDNKKRALIFDAYHKVTIENTVEILNLANSIIEEIPNKLLSWLTVCILKFDQPEEANNQSWFSK